MPDRALVPASPSRADAVLPPPDAFERVLRQTRRLFGGAEAFVARWTDGHLDLIPTPDAAPRASAEAARVLESGQAQIAPLGDSAGCFAGAPVLTPDGVCVGALCVVAPGHEALSADDVAALQDLAALAACAWRLDEEMRHHTRTEQRLRDALDDARHNLESIAEAFVSIDPHWRITYVNPQAVRRSGLSRDELVGHVVWDRFPGSQETTFYPELIRALETQTPVVVEGLYGDSWYRMKGVPHRKGLSLLISDVTQRRQAEEALRASEARAHLLVQHLSDVICVMEPSGQLTYVSPSCERLLGCSADELCGQNVFPFIHPDDLPAAQGVLEVCSLQHGARPPFGFRWQRPDGSTVPLEAIGHNLLHEPTLRGIVVTVRDATERHRAVKALEQSLEKERQVNELRASFVAMASHEFRTPLATILSSANLATRFLDKSREKTDKHLQRISQTVQDMLELLDDLLELERLGADETRPEAHALDLPALLAEILDELRHGLASGHDLHLSGDVPPLIEIDRVTLRLILSNLLTNAVKYSPEGSTVTLDVSRPEPGAPVVAFRVTDTGIGIPEHEMGLLFEPFHRAANVGTIQGTGLGLSMVKQAVDRNGGTIHVSSELGTGTTFEVVLPLRARRAASLPPSP